MPVPVLTDFVKAYDVRGVVPEQLNVDVAWAIGAAFARLVAADGATGVVIGHDMRPSSPELSRAFAAGAEQQDPAAVDLLHHRQPVTGPGAGRHLHVEVQAVLALRG